MEKILVKLLKFFDVDPDPVSGIFSTRDGKILIRIRNTGCKISVSTLYLPCVKKTSTHQVRMNKIKVTIFGRPGRIKITK
jgi:hypothetical protein